MKVVMAFKTGISFQKYAKSMRLPLIYLIHFIILIKISSRTNKSRHPTRKSILIHQKSLSFFLSTRSTSNLTLTNPLLRNRRRRRRITTPRIKQRNLTILLSSVPHRRRQIIHTRHLCILIPIQILLIHSFLYRSKRQLTRTF